MRQQLHRNRLNIMAAIMAVIGVMIYIYSCHYTERVKPVESVQLALDWNRFLLDAEVSTEGYRGPVAARAYGYIGLAAYEAAVPGLIGYQSQAELFNGLMLPAPPAAGEYDLEVALNAAYATVMQYFFLSSPETIKRKWLEMRTRWDQSLAATMDSVTFERSKLYGENVGRAVFEWSETDSIGRNGNLHNYDRNYKAPTGDGMWVSSAYFPMPPLLPSWGGVRTFVIDAEEYLAQPLPAYSADPNQFYHTQSMEVLTLNTPLSSENKWICDFWNDDRPGLTFTPAGHWLSITNQVIEKERPPIEKTLETYLRVGFALSDAIVTAWKSKYYYNLERPETFIRKHIAKDWKPYSPTPSFPSYPSGHSIMGAAAAQVLGTMYGDNYELEDKSHEGLREFSTNPRKFKSFKEMADENAMSRILMGVHYRVDCEEGLRLGDLIGREVTKLKLEKKLTQ